MDGDKYGKECSKCCERYTIVDSLRKEETYKDREGEDRVSSDTSFGQQRTWFKGWRRWGSLRVRYRRLAESEEWLSGPFAGTRARECRAI